MLLLWAIKVIYMILDYVVKEWSLKIMMKLILTVSQIQIWRKVKLYYMIISFRQLLCYLWYWWYWCCVLVLTVYFKSVVVCSRSLSGSALLSRSRRGLAGGDVIE